MFLLCTVSFDQVKIWSQEYKKQFDKQTTNLIAGNNKAYCFVFYVTLSTVLCKLQSVLTSCITN